MSTLAAPEVNNKNSTRAFEQLFRAHSQFVYRTAYGVTGNAEDAEDVLQTIFLRLVRRELPPNLRSNPKAYLYRAAVNVSLSVIRSRRLRHPAGDLETVERSVDTVRMPQDGELRDRLLAVLDTMDESDSQAVELLILRYFHGYSDSDIASMFGKARSTIAVRLFRARARVRKLMRVREKSDETRRKKH
jgi:RNA polymerase sigma-70 factor, ECF subfamily